MLPFMDDRYIDVPDARRPDEVLNDDPIYLLLGRLLTMPAVLGMVCALLAVLMIVAGPSTDSRFIYTDF